MALRLFMVWPNRSSLKYETQESYYRHMKLTFLWFNKHLVLKSSLEDSVNIFDVLLFIFRVDEDVTQIDKYKKKNVQKISEDIIYKGLEYFWGTGYLKGIMPR